MPNGLDAAETFLTPNPARGRLRIPDFAPPQRFRNRKAVTHRLTPRPAAGAWQARAKFPPGYRAPLRGGAPLASFRKETLR
jgi:hypothetical protein